ncbi:MAG: deoxyribodipyrimidine photo-lyase [Verrucomicrobia bacterium]|jgi:deoxyribodipyrimidine photo-lyase|nr:deoxyribodipyrimidine photo-lyase [Verrucomicrobiota bacterium]
MPDSPTILWFRKDLRLEDNKALEAAIAAGDPIIPVFIWAPQEAGDWAPGAASKWFLHQALKSLDASLQEHGGRLVLRAGDSLSELRTIFQKTGARRVVWNRRYEGPLRELDASIKKALREDGYEVESYNSSLLHEPHTVSTGGGKPYKVYTPYWRRVKDRPLPGLAEPDFSKIRFPGSYPQTTALESLNLLPKEQWYRKFQPYWEVSEAAARKRLDNFLETSVRDYSEARDIPGETGTSGLSPYLHWGLIGPRQIMHTLLSRHDLRAQGPQVYAKEVYWREFAYNVLYHFPHTPDAPLQEKYADFPWEPDAEALKRWQQGQTGYPIVDAGMRELYATGWMHNRVRMVVSSFLVKHLLQDWREGARWFWDTLVDADLASNTLGWQWSGGCGADAAPYFRVFNPMTQGHKFDPEGDYVRRWVPELAKLPNKYIHEPWEAPDGILQHAEVDLGETYPEPIIDHKKGRERALAALAELK